MYGLARKTKSQKKGTGLISTKQLADDGDDIEALEDFGNKHKSSAERRTVVCNYKHSSDNDPMDGSSGAEHQVKPAETNKSSDQSSSALQPDSQTEHIDRNTDYQGWLEMKKRKWKDTLTMRKKQRYVLFGDNNDHS